MLTLQHVVLKQRKDNTVLFKLLSRFPTGALIVSIQSLAGETARDRRRRECRELYELRLAEW